MRRARVLMLAGLLLLASTGAQATGSTAPGSNTGGASAPSSPREGAATCAVVQIHSDVDRRNRERFSATHVLELRFGARVSGGSKREHTLRLRLYTPSGFLYQVLAVPVPAGGGRHAVEARLPIAGTSIMASGLYGRWRLEPRLDDASEPCGRGRSFVIRP